jgi:hypothetical protein
MLSLNSACSEGRDPVMACFSMSLNFQVYKMVCIMSMIKALGLKCRNCGQHMWCMDLGTVAMIITTISSNVTCYSKLIMQIHGEA